jgi:probable F420-dependent oxidoreductase
VKVGTGLPLAGPWATPEHMRETAVLAERLGYASLWTFQRLLHPLDEEWGPSYHSVHDPITSLAYVAGATSTIRLGLAIVNVPFYAPIVLAKALTTLDHVSGGRLDVGLGLGWSPQEFAAVGVDSARRGARGEEFVAALTAIWTDPEAGFDGEFYHLPPAHVDPRPVQQPRPPLLLGGTADVALRRAGRIADGWISSSRTDLTEIGSSIALVKAAAADAGRDPGLLRFVVRGVVVYGPEDGADRKPLQGSAAQIRDDLAALEAAGVTEVFLDLNYDPSMVADDVDPAWAQERAVAVLTALAPAAG